MRTVLLLLMCLLLMSPEASSQTPVVTRGPYLQMAYSTRSNPFYTRSSVTIRWRTNVPTIGRVVYSEWTESLDNGGRIAEETAASTEHKIVLTDLVTDQRYNYYIGAGAAGPFPAQGPLILERSADHTFTTPPPPGSKRKIKMWVLGDFGFSPSTSFNNRQDSTIAAMKDFMAVNKTGPMDMWLWLGDNAYEHGRDDQYQENIFHKGRGRYDWIFRQTPFYATPGNHDYYDGARDVPHRDSIRWSKNIHYYSVVDNFKNGEGGGEPSGTEAYYSYDYGNIHCISLDTYGYEKYLDDDAKILAKTSVQYNWLKRDLIKARANRDINWIIVFTHMPPYSGGSHDSDTDGSLASIRANLIPLLDSNKVDIVFSGHSHDYQRTRMMRGHYNNSTNFVAANNLGPAGSNASGSGRYDGTPNSCFYYKTTDAPQNEGIIYVVNGGGGRAEEAYPSNNKGLVERLMYTTQFMGGSMYLEVENKRLIAKFIGANKQVLDQFVIYKDLDNFKIPRTDGTSRTATCECTESLNANTSFTHYLDNNANLILSINKHDINIGRVGIPPFEVKLSGANGKTNVGAFYPDNYVRSDRTRTFSSNWRVMNRYWTVKPATELTAGQQVTVRHYYTTEDFFNVFSAQTNEDLVFREYLKFYKINSLGATYNIDPVSNVHATLPGATAYNTNGIWVYDKSTDILPAQASQLHWRNGYFGTPPPVSSPLKSEMQYGEIVVGKLAGGGGIGGQGSNINPRGTKALISSGDRWKYFAKGSAPADYTYQSNGVTEVLSWKGGSKIIDYYENFVPWNEGVAPLGYSPNREDGERWLLPGCATELACYVADYNGAYFTPGCLTTPCSTRWTTYYFRKTITVPDLANTAYKSLIINYKRDDGVVIYVNGKELLPRDPQMPAGSALATSGAEHVWNTIVIPNDGSYFRKSPFNATNTVAVELYQNSNTSTDIQFDMEVVLSQDVLTAPARISVTEQARTAEPANTFYPNPTDGKVYFTVPLTYETIRITDSRGVVLRYLSRPGILNELDVSGMPTGILILTNQNNGQVSNFKIIKK